MVSRRRIHGEIRNFSRYIQNLIKSDDEFWWEIIKIVFLERRLYDEFKNKNTQFGLVFEENSRSKEKRENLIMKREKMTKFYKIKLIYASK